MKKHLMEIQTQKDIDYINQHLDFDKLLERYITKIQEANQMLKQYKITAYIIAYLSMAIGALLVAMIILSSFIR